MPNTSMPQVLSVKTLEGDKVVNRSGENLGKLESIMIDLNEGRVAYAVLSFGGFLGMGDKLFAVPWKALSVDTNEKRLIFDVDKEKLKKAPGFDKDHWPNMADPNFHTDIHKYYGVQSYQGL